MRPPSPLEFLTTLFGVGIYMDTQGRSEGGPGVPMTPSPL